MVTKVKEITETSASVGLLLVTAVVVNQVLSQGSASDLSSSKYGAKGPIQLGGLGHVPQKSLQNLNWFVTFSMIFCR